MYSQWSEENRDVQGIQLHYLRTGKGDKPPLILVHGFSDNGRCWTPVAQERKTVVFPIYRIQLCGHNNVGVLL